jgi:hypothetical protein
MVKQHQNGRQAPVTRHDQGSQGTIHTFLRDSLAQSLQLFEADLARFEVQHQRFRRTGRNAGKW